MSSSFCYTYTPYRFIAEYSGGKWDEGRLSADAEIRLNESACVLQYAQTCFEGLKAYRTQSGKVVCFRPELNAQRLADSCRRMMIPPVSEELFLRAVDRTVEANLALVPSAESGGALYLRPFIFGTTAVLGVSPAEEFQFRVFACPVGSYFGEKVSSLSLTVSDYDRAAPHGTGHVKAGLNYAMSLYPLVKAHEDGYNENVYTDPASHSYLEETGGANLFFVTKDHRIVTPQSDTILPSITRRSMITIARDYLHLEVEERPIRKEEMETFAECGLCGTAAVIAPVGSIHDHGKIVLFATDCGGYGEVSARLRDTLLGIQHETLPAPAGWIHTVRTGEES